MVSHSYRCSPSRRGILAGAGAMLLTQAAWAAGDENLDSRTGQALYAAALAMVRKKICGGPGAPYFRKPYLDAAFSDNIFLWDTCFIATYAKFHQDELPISQALDNFYGLQDPDGWICREYRADGTPMWPKHHPVSINPPLLAFAELELYGCKPDRERLERVYPALKKFFAYLIKNYRQEDGLFFSDAFGSGMDNIPRYPDGWKDDAAGIGNANLHPEIFVYDGLSPLWNRQGRSVDFSAQMALCAEHLIEIAEIVGCTSDISAYSIIRRETIAALNERCWEESDGFYYDLGYGRRIRRKHIGMFWTLMAGAVPENRVAPMLAHLTDDKQFWRAVPVASFPADQPGYSPQGSYWLGSVWAPTNYMIVRGLMRYGRRDLALKLARQYYACVAAVHAQTGTFWENYAPDAFARGNWARPDFCGWAAIAPITLYREILAT